MNNKQKDIRWGIYRSNVEPFYKVASEILNLPEEKIEIRKGRIKEFGLGLTVFVYKDDYPCYYYMDSCLEKRYDNLSTSLNGFKKELQKLVEKEKINANKEVQSKNSVDKSHSI